MRDRIIRAIAQKIRTKSIPIVCIDNLKGEELSSLDILKNEMYCC